MTEEEAYEKYPNLKDIDQMDLIILRHNAIRDSDKDFQQAIDAILKELPE